ncbi:hypothetical protein AAM05_22870 [Salmonella enterica subsp. enterica serovar Typhimurium]|nr:hypothetical protein [Salmonella enterica subsp. enterica serovar Typhimurium]
MNKTKGCLIANFATVPCNLDSQGAIYLCESAKAGAVLIFWHELAINGYASMNAIKRQELIDADFQRLRNLIWPEDDR